MPEPRLTRVLVVDDDPLLCELLRVTLATEGIEVTAAHHVIHAEKLLAESVPDAIVLDIGLPGVDGVFYCERLRESPRTKRLPIIAISGSEDAGVMAAGAGADAFVHKPFDPLQLVAVLERVAGLAPPQEPTTGVAGRPAPPVADPPAPPRPSCRLAP